MTDDLDLHQQAQLQRMYTHLQTVLAQAGGWISFARYMDEALYAPGLGYYSAGARKLGAGGDFTTAPELSSLFGGCVARQCEQVLRSLGGGDVLELGAGSGRLAFDVLQALAQADCLPQRYLILEVSADLRQRQQALLATLPAALAGRVQWLDAPPAQGLRGVLLANEVLDALPCDCFALGPDGQVIERGVALDAAGALVWQLRPAPALLAAEVQRLQSQRSPPMEPGYASELCLRAGPWIATVTAQLQAGVALFIDYGLPRATYYQPARDGGTLRCHWRQRAHDDPLVLPGLQDITAWVDFTRVAEAADDGGLQVLGFTTQMGFLLGTGIESLIAAAPEGVARTRLLTQARELLMPEAMGESFKVIALGRQWQEPLAGFAVQDLLERL
jgi:SAM-dependent MidA family methyltransferase